MEQYRPDEIITIDEIVMARIDQLQSDLTLVQEELGGRATWYREDVNRLYDKLLDEQQRLIGLMVTPLDEQLP